MKNVTLLLEKLAEQLGVGVGEMWRILLMEAEIMPLKIVLGLCVILVCLIIMIIILAYGIYSQNEELIVTGCVTTIVGFIILLSFLFAAGNVYITCKMNPEYYALEKILNIIGGR